MRGRLHSRRRADDGVHEYDESRLHLLRGWKHVQGHGGESRQLPLVQLLHDWSRHDAGLYRIQRHAVRTVPGRAVQGCIWKRGVPDLYIALRCRLRGNNAVHVDDEPRLHGLRD
jgi:hypothetical protein